MLYVYFGGIADKAAIAENHPQGLIWGDGFGEGFINTGIETGVERILGYAENLLAGNGKPLYFKAEVQAQRALPVQQIIGYDRAYVIGKQIERCLLYSCGL